MSSHGVSARDVLIRWARGPGIVMLLSAGLLYLVFHGVPDVVYAVWWWWWNSVIAPPVDLVSWFVRLTIDESRDAFWR